MLRLMRKFSLYHCLYSATLVGAVYPLLEYDRRTGPDPLSFSFAFYLAPYLIWILLGAIWTLEQVESKSNAIEFLSILPIEKRSIVSAKLYLILFSVVFDVGFFCIVFRMISKDPQYWIPSCTFIIHSGGCCLVLCGLCYVGIFQFGFSRFGKVIFLLWTASLLSSILIDLLVIKKMGMSRTAIITGVSRIPWYAGIVASLAAFWALLGIGTRVFSKESPRRRRLCGV